MSLVPHFVELDGVWFKNLTIRSSKGDWFLCFDDDEPPEVVVKQESIKDRNRRSWDELKDCIIARLKSAGIVAVSISRINRSDRIFDKDWEKKKGPFYMAYSMYVEIKVFHPNHFTYLDHDGTLNVPEEDRPQGVYYSYPD